MNIEKKDGYVVDLYDRSIRYSELMRIANQGDLLSDVLPIVFDDFTCSPGGRIIDNASGAGDWVIKMAQKFPQTRVIGIDILPETVPHANSLAKVHKLTNAEFYEGNIFDSLSYPSNTFDLVNSRFIMSLIPARPDNYWLPYLAECFRMTKPGGWLQLMEPDCLIIANAPAFDMLNALIESVIYEFGKGFSRYSLGMGPILPRLIKDAGYVDIQRQPFVIDCSFESDFYEKFVKDFQVLLQHYKQSKPFQQALFQRISEMDYNKACGEAEDEFKSKDFRCDWHAMRVIGRKPKPE